MNTNTPWLVTRKGLQHVGLSLVLLVIYANLGAATPFSVSQENNILYPFYTWGFRALILALFLTLWVFSAIRYVMADGRGNTWGQRLLSFVIAVSIILTFSIPGCGF